jgi:hypothetical protein
VGGGGKLSIGRKEKAEGWEVEGSSVEEGKRRLKGGRWREVT